MRPAWSARCRRGKLTEAPTTDSVPRPHRPRPDNVDMFGSKTGVARGDGSVPSPHQPRPEWVDVIERSTDAGTRFDSARVPIPQKSSPEATDASECRSSRRRTLISGPNRGRAGRVDDDELVRYRWAGSKREESGSATWR